MTCRRGRWTRAGRCCVKKGLPAWHCMVPCADLEAVQCACPPLQALAWKTPPACVPNKAAFFTMNCVSFSVVHSSCG
jgi:hypothetical protein